MIEGLLFANSVAKAKEEKLFSEERLKRMSEATSLNDAVKILVEANYGGGLVPDSYDDYEQILSAEEKEALDFISHSALVNAGFECFFLQADYFNAKALLKDFYRKSNSPVSLKNGGYISPSTIKEEILKDEPKLTPYLNDAIKQIKKICEASVSPRAIDTIIDKAMFKDISDRLNSRNADKYVKLYFNAYIDCINACSYVRSARIGENERFFVDGFIDGGSIGKEKFVSAYPDIDKLVAIFKNSKYSSFAEKITAKEMTEFDTARDNYLLNIFHANRSDMFTVAPIMGYYIAKMNEIKTIRIVLVYVKNGVDKLEISKRLRKMYA